MRSALFTLRYSFLFFSGESQTRALSAVDSSIVINHHLSFVHIRAAEHLMRLQCVCIPCAIDSLSRLRSHLTNEYIHVHDILWENIQWLSFFSVSPVGGVYTVHSPPTGLTEKRKHRCVCVCNVHVCIQGMHCVFKTTVLCVLLSWYCKPNKWNVFEIYHLTFVVKIELH